MMLIEVVKPDVNILILLFLEMFINNKNPFKRWFTHFLKGFYAKQKPTSPDKTSWFEFRKKLNGSLIICIIY
mgnify:CR=1 FL=1